MLNNKNILCVFNLSLWTNVFAGDLWWSYSKMTYTVHIHINITFVFHWLHMKSHTSLL